MSASAPVIDEIEHQEEGARPAPSEVKLIDIILVPYFERWPHSKLWANVSLQGKLSIAYGNKQFICEIKTKETYNIIKKEDLLYESKRMFFVIRMNSAADFKEIEISHMFKDDFFAASNSQFQDLFDGFKTKLRGIIAGDENIWSKTRFHEWIRYHACV